MSEGKRALRSATLAARARVAPGDRAASALAVADRIAAVPGFLEARVLALYAPLGGELDPSEIARRARARGAGLAYPRTLPGERRLAFGRAGPEALVPGPLGALEPPPGAPDVPLADVECVVVPGVAFSLDGHRLGRGGGHYDATLAAMPRALRVGLAFEAQLVPALPREPHDEPLDAVVTEGRTLLFRRPRAGASAT